MVIAPTIATGMASTGTISARHEPQGLCLTPFQRGDNPDTGGYRKAAAQGDAGAENNLAVADSRNYREIVEMLVVGIVRIHVRMFHARSSE